MTDMSTVVGHVPRHISTLCNVFYDVVVLFLVS